MSLLRSGKFKLAMKGILDPAIVDARACGVAAIGEGGGGDPKLV